MRYRALSTNNKYYLPKETYLTAFHFSLQYPQWVQELNTLPDSGSAIQYDKDKVQTSNTYDANAELAMRRYEIEKKKKLVDDTAREVCERLQEWIILGVCYGLTFWQLKDKGMDCERDRYYQLRRRYYYELAKKI